MAVAVAVDGGRCVALRHIRVGIYLFYLLYAAPRLSLASVGQF